MKRSPRWLGAVVGLVLAVLVAGPAYAELISTQQEINIGRQVARQLEEKYGLYRDPDIHSRVVAIGERLAAVSDRPGLPYSFKILNTSEVNAVAAPGGFIYLTRGMVFFVRSDDELAFVLAHEVAHAARRHGAQMIERNFAWSLGLFILIRILGGDPTAAQIADFAR
ncbi:MAG: M48 family metalloprotease, partial [Armatimonadota bacterium]|nr:M48 family metalloprotease [Armatimonadota bacterium]